MKVRVLVTISGLVQGVAFRQQTVDMAMRHRVNGWVRNLANGNVEACFEGEEKDVSAVVDWCRRGPSRARVDQINAKDRPFTGEFTSFSVRY